ncbi:MAG: MutS-related protein, partial [bacterium]
NILVREWNEEVIFLRRIEPGGTDKSYGIQVARLAGLPPKVVARSKEILESLERHDTLADPVFPREEKRKRTMQLSLFVNPEEYICSKLLSMDLKKSSLQEVLKAVKEWRKLLTGE